ncbi:5'-3' DNA helicase ZGRF1 isoform X1 [Phascolarctos cinereus]|uniref:5'-3' DNA helicase ZGRF1 n=1 Tax=Phascolarctos cinereus TaxID=38626 RepID=A0A6P5LKD4_PHACI|nr:protein ZGRF1 isoform X3 [Phascolarctos cinereus]
MASQEFIVLYTHQKTKKSKVWQDGILKISFSGNKATLYDDKGQCLESLFLKQSEVKPGDDLESDRYLITVEDVKIAENIPSNLEIRTEVPKLSVQGLKPSNKPKPCPPTGLKRKFTGFQGPRQVPKKIATLENSESAASLLSKESCPTFSSLFFCTPPLFSTAGKKNRDTVRPSDCNSVVDYKNSDTNDMSISSLLSPTSITSNQKGFCDEDDYSFLNSVTRKSDCSLDPEYMKENCLTTRGSATSQNVRSKEQILALLKSKSTAALEVVECFSPGQLTEEIKGPLKPQCIIEREEEIMEMNNTKNISHQGHLENSVRKSSRWDIYLPKSLSASSSDVSNTEGKSKDQDDNLDLDLKGPFEQKEMCIFATGSEKKVVCKTDGQIDNDDQTTCDQKINFQVSSSCQSELGTNLPIVCSNNEHHYLLSKSKSEMLFNNDYPKCIKGSVFSRGNVQEQSKTGGPERESHLKLSSQPEWEYPQLQRDSSCLSNNLAISDNLATFVSKSRAENENIKTNTDLNSTPETFLEVTFNLDNFDISDTEEDSQNSDIFPLGSEHSVKKLSSEDRVFAEGTFEDRDSSQEDDKEHLSHLITVNSSPPAKLPSKKTLSSQICTETSIDFDRIGKGNEASFLFNPNLPEVENVEEEMTVDTSNFETLSRGTKWDSSSEQTDVVLTYGNGHCDGSVPPTVTDYDHVPSQTKKQFTEACYSSDTPEPLNLYQDSTRQVLQENQDEILAVRNESFESLQSSLKDEEENAFVALIPKEKKRKSCKPKPSDGENFLEEDLTFRGEDDFQMTTDFIKDTNENDSYSDNTVSSYSLDDNLKLSEWSSWKRNKMMSPVQKISTLSPDSTFPLSPRDEDIMIKLPEESLKARTSSGVEKFNWSEKVNVQRRHRARIPLITLPPVKVHPLSENCSHRMDSEVQKSFGSPILDPSYEESAGSPVSSFGPEDRNRETSVSQKSGEETPIRLSFSSLVPPLSKRSRWLKYQNTPQGDSITLHRSDVKVNENFCAAFAPGVHLDGAEGYQNGAAKKSPKDSVYLEMIKGKLHEQQADFYCQESVFRKKTPFQNFEQTSQTEEIQKMLSQMAHNGLSVTGSTQINASALSFPSGQISKCACIPKRQIHIPAIFQSPAQYKQVFTTSLIEHLNILLFEVSKRLHQALSKVDISFYTSMKAEKKKNTGNSIPTCHHQQPTKLVMVKKDGPNKGRLFYTCDAPKANQCKFFKWLEEVTPVNLAQAESVPSTVLHDIKSTGIYLRCQNIPLYEECQLLVRKGFDFQNKQYGKSKRFAHVNPEFHNESKSKLYLKLSRRESSSSYGKDDLWVISKTLDFELDTFIACSAFFGPSSYNEVELLPLKGYFPSNWPSDTVVHALLICNASTELTTLRNLQEYFNPTTLPILQHLLTTSYQTEHSNNRISKRKFIPPALNRSTNKNCEPLSPEGALQLANEMIQIYKLNMDQATALIQIAQMMASQENVSDLPEQHTIPITIIHGVFGAGKSYLLAVVILFLVQLFEKSPAPTGVEARPWKILISSSTNVAVDRVLLGLLSLGFEKFIRVGSIRKISKPILPYSLHAGLGNESEQLKELHALMKEDLTPVEKIYVRKSIEQHKLGTNRALLKQVQVVGITCAACPFPCMNNLKFPIVVLDECSQMTEPASLLPIARFDCEKLVLVGDPKQLPPTIQGSESAHDSGLEQTLFDRLCLMGHKAILLRTQYRCHPAISAIANDLFYEGHLINGISEVERSPLLEWLPTLCFYNVKGIEQIEKANSFHNVAEAAFTLKLIQSLIASGIEGSMIGVITLYKSQMYKLCTLLSTVHCDHATLKAVQVSTVDAFQGAEKEIVILSCVRTKHVGFIDSEKRMNVALTRGKRHLLIVGNLDCLKKNRLWGRVIQHCEGRENGLQHSSQCEPNLNLLLKSYLEKKAEEKEKSQKENSKNKSLSQKDTL